MKTSAPIMFSVPFLTTCTDPTPSPATIEKSSSAMVAHDPVPVVRFARPSRNEVQVSEGISRIGAVLGPAARIVSARQDRMPLAANAAIQQVRFDLDFDAPTLKGRHESRDDSFEVYDTQFSASGPQPGDVDQAAALAIFEGVFHNLVSRGVVHAARSSISDAVTRLVHAAEGNNQVGMLRQWIDEYAFFVPTKIEGIAVGTDVQEYGVTVNVHKSGKVRRIEVSGAALAANDSGAASIIRRVEPAVRARSGEAELSASLGRNAIVKSLGQRFVVDENNPGGDLVPRALFQVSLVGVGPAGEAIHGKAFVASNAVDSVAPLQLSPTPGWLGPNPDDRTFRK